MVIDPVGTAPGLVVAGKPTVVVLPGPPRELHPMWEEAVATSPCAKRLPGVPATSRPWCGCSGFPSRAWPRRCARPSARWTASTRSRSPPACGAARSRWSLATSRGAGAYESLMGLVRERHGREIFSEDGSRVDDQVAELLGPAAGHGRVVHRRPDRGAPDRPAGLLGVRGRRRRGVRQRGEGRAAGRGPGADRGHGAVSEEVAEAMAEGSAAFRGGHCSVGHRDCGARWRHRGQAGGHRLLERAAGGGRRPHARGR